MAFLAALPKAPNNYNPKKKYEEAIARRNWVIDKMIENNFIDKKRRNLESKIAKSLK